GTLAAALRIRTLVTGSRLILTRAPHRARYADRSRRRAKTAALRHGTLIAGGDGIHADAGAHRVRLAHLGRRADAAALRVGTLLAGRHRGLAVAVPRRIGCADL